MAALLRSLQEWLDWFWNFFYHEEMELTLVGLQYSGKTTLVNVISQKMRELKQRRKALVRWLWDGMSGDYNEDTIPTVGFNMRKITKGRVTMKFWDVGGQPRFRTMWERYCRGVDAIVFVIDAADHDRLPAAKAELHALLEKPQLAEIPVLVLGNKNDLPEALTREKMVEVLELKGISDREVSYYSISAKNQVNIDVTLKWLTQHAKSRN